MSAESGARTHVRGLRRGRELDVSAAMRRSRDGLQFDCGRGVSLRLSLASLDGYQLDGDRAVLYLDGDDVLELDVAHEPTRIMLRSALDTATAVPELARSLRFVGGATGAHASAQDRWFAPLLSARRAMVGVSDPMRQLGLFDVDRIGAELRRALLELAAQHTGGDAPRARALEALLEEQADGVWLALGRVALAATTLEGSAFDSRIADWRTWITCVRALFREVDEAWPGLERTLHTGP